MSISCLTKPLEQNNIFAKVLFLRIM